MTRRQTRQHGARAALALALALAGGAAAAAPLRLAEALRLALAANPDVLVQQSVAEAARGQQMQAAGQFDLVLTSGADFSRLISASAVAGIDQRRSLATGYRVGASRQSRGGVTLGTSLEASSYRDSAVSGAQAPGTVTLGVTLTLPLLRGSGAREVAAAEDAATLLVAASDLTLRDTASQALYRTLTAYWTYVTRAALVTVARDSEERSGALFASTRKLVEASEKPRADLVLLQADLADRTAAREAATLALDEARSALGRLLGLDAAAIAALAAPADPLPAILAVRMPAAAALAGLRAAAQERRPDLLALAAQSAAAERQAQAAQRQLRPVLDLELGVLVAKASDGARHFPLAGDSGRLQNGPSLVARLNYQFPLQNTTARGLVRERDALLAQYAIRRHDLAGAVDSGVDGALQSLSSSAAQLQVAQAALALYEQAVAQEIIKQRNGIATLIDVINVETRFINARTGYLLTHLAYANAIARLRFETGTLLPPARLDAGGDHFELDLAELAGLGPLARQLVIAP